MMSAAYVDSLAPSLPHSNSPPLPLSLTHSCNALFMCLQLLLTECQRQQLTAIMFALCAAPEAIQAGVLCHAGNVLRL